MFFENAESTAFVKTIPTVSEKRFRFPLQCCRTRQDRSIRFGQVAAMETADMSITASQCRAARAMLDWSQETLVEGADIELDILCAFEHGHSKLDLELQDRLRAALEKAGISFIDDNQTSAAGGPGVRMLRSPGEFDTDQSKTVQYTENLAPDAPTGAGG